MKAFIQKTAPQFAAQAWIARTKQFKQIALNDFKSKYVLLFFYPLDFTFVCPTEIIQFSNKASEFRKLNCEVLGCSVDSHFSHMAYTERPREKGGLGEIDIPLLGDVTKNIARDYGVLLEGGIALRGTFIIDGKQILRHSSINDLPVGRNVDEYIRLVKAFQYTDEHGEVCPASWKPGDATMKPNWTANETKTYWENVHTKK